MLSVALLASGCASKREAPKAGDLYGPGPRGYIVGKPYRVNGVWYYPAEDERYDRVGFASWYGPGFHGRHTASGERYDRRRFTAAHPTLPMPVVVRVTNLKNGRSTLVRVNDRGPFIHGRIIDLSEAAADALGFRHDGLARVRVQYVGRADRMPKAAAPSAPQPPSPPSVPVASAAEPTGALPDAAEPIALEASAGTRPYIVPHSGHDPAHFPVEMR
jgi:rare lipoprotein A